MDFLNDYINIKTVGISAAISGFLLGALLMKAWRRYREPKDSRLGYDLYNKVSELLETERAQSVDYRYKITLLENRIDEIMKADKTIAEKLACLKEVETRIEDEYKIFRALQNINSKTQNAIEVIVYEQQQEAIKQSKKEAREKKEETENDTPKTPKNTR